MGLIPTPMPADFNPHTQNISFFNPDGTTVTIGLNELDAINQANVKVCSIFASQIGACALLFTVLVMLTKPEKRRAPIFLLNAFSLLLVITRSVLQLLYFVGPWAETYNYVAYYYEDIPISDKYTSLFMGVVQLVLHVCIMLSLVLQIRVVYAASPTVNFTMTLLSAAVAATSIGFVAVVVVQASQAIMSGVGYNEWVYKAARGIFAGTIFFFSGVFSFKLAFAIRRRKVLRLQSFGPLQVIFIMGCQTMIVPAIFASIENAVNFDGMSSLTATLVVLSLPLSSMWAAAQTDGQSPKLTPKTAPPKFASKVSTLVNVSASPKAKKKVPVESGPLGLHVDKTFDIESSPSTGCNPGGSSRQRGLDYV